jgi:ribosomal protein S19E (S16A)
MNTENTNSPSGSGEAGAVQVRKLGRAQFYVLRMCNPEWPTKHPDARSVRVLRTLEARGLVYQNFGRWYITSKGSAILDAADAQTIRVERIHLTEQQRATLTSTAEFIPGASS